MSEQHPFGSASGDELWAAVARVTAGQATPEERDSLRAHLAAHPERAALLEALEGAVDRYRISAHPPVDVEAALAQVMARREARPAPRAESPWIRPLLRLAAVLVVALGLAVVWRSRAVGEAVVHTAAVGETRRILLADRSRVVLGPGSRLAVAADYGRRRRVVELTGEAYFEVRHDAERPFVVHAGAAEIEDLGTAFLVRTAGDGSARVGVTEGVVGLSARSAAADSVLRQGDRGRVDAAGRVSVQRQADLAAEIAWPQGRLVVQETSLAELAPEFARWYGVALVVNDTALARRRITATFPAGDPRGALSILEAALGVEIHRAGDSAVVTRRGTP